MMQKKEGRNQSPGRLPADRLGDLFQAGAATQGTRGKSLPGTKEERRKWKILQVFEDGRAGNNPSVPPGAS